MSNINLIHQRTQEDKSDCQFPAFETDLCMFSRLYCTDGSEFLFLAPSETLMEDWVNKISFHAQLPPSLQLLSYDDSQKVSQYTGTTIQEKKKTSIFEEEVGP